MKPQNKKNQKTKRKKLREIITWTYPNKSDRLDCCWFGFETWPTADDLFSCEKVNCKLFTWQNEIHFGKLVSLFHFLFLNLNLGNTHNLILFLSMNGLQIVEKKQKNCQHRVKKQIIILGEADFK